MAMAIAMRTTFSPIAGGKKLLFRHRINLIRSFSSTSDSNQTKLILYSKPGCCLCDGLKEKLNAALSLSSSSPSLLHVHLEVRDITTNPDWENAYQFEIPVLAKLRSDGLEERIPRWSPRLGVEMIQQKVADALSQQ